MIYEHLISIKKHTLKVNLIKVLLFLCFISSCSVVDENKRLDVYISTSGNDYQNGDIDHPLETIDAALELVRRHKNRATYIWLRKGTYYLSKTIKLTSDDSRFKQAPLEISAYQDEKVVITGGMKLHWNKVIDNNVLSQLSGSVKNKLIVTNLKEHGVVIFGSPKGKGVELYYNDKKMTLARYPNKEYLSIESLVEPNTHNVRSIKGSKAGKFIYKSDRLVKWNKESDIWAHGFWFYNWRDEKQKIKSIDDKTNEIELEKPYHGFGYRKGQRYFLYNLLSEIDIPNEWYLDRITGNLYFYPLDNMNEDELLVSVLDNLISLENVSYVSIKNIDFSSARNNGISITEGMNNLVENVVIKHIGNDAVTIINSPNSVVKSSNIFSIGATGININGGDRKTLTSSNICAINNRIHNFALAVKTYKPGVSLKGVGNCAKNNDIFDAPHVGVLFSGNNHLIEYNNIYDVVKESNDAGAIYTGRDWSARGNILRYNYIHDILGLNKNGAKGIYLDDEASGSLVYGNIFDKVNGAVFIGGGRYNIVENNLFVNSEPSVHIDNRGKGSHKGHLDYLMEKLTSVPYKSDVWVRSYPKIVNILNNNFREPVGNQIKNNVFYDKKWNEIKNGAIPFQSIQDNVEVFNDKPSLNYQIDPLINNFNNIPFHLIGSK